MGSETAKVPSSPHLTTPTGNEPDQHIATASKHPKRPQEREVEWRNKVLRRDKELSEREAGR